MLISKQDLLDSNERARACGEIKIYSDMQALHPGGSHVLAIESGIDVVANRVPVDDVPTRMLIPNRI